MSEARQKRETRELAAWLAVISAITIAAFGIGGGVGAAAVAAVIMGGLAAFLLLGRGHSGTAEVVAGVGDERTKMLYLRATWATATIMALVILGWFLVTMAQGDGNETLSTLALIYNVALIGSAAYFTRRG